MAKEGEKGHWESESGSSTLLIILKDSSITLMRKREQDEWDYRQGTGLTSLPMLQMINQRHRHILRK